MSSVSIASDYAVLEANGMRFYYGYEVYDQDSEVWCFEGEIGEDRDGVPRMIVWNYKELKLKDRFDVVDGLLKGIGRLIKDGYLVEGKTDAISTPTDAQ